METRSASPPGELRSMTRKYDREINMNQTPKLLPWYARKAGVSEQRATTLWQRAVRQATRRTGWVGNSEYWREAMTRFLGLLEAEKAHQIAPNVMALVRTQNRLLGLPIATLELFCGTATRWREQQRQRFEAFWHKAA